MEATQASGGGGGGGAENAFFPFAEQVRNFAIRSVPLPTRCQLDGASKCKMRAEN